MNLQQPISLSSTYISTLHTSSSLKLSPWDKDDDNVNVQELEVDAFTLQSNVLQGFSYYEQLQSLLGQTQRQQDYS